ncbi:AcrR family transcriptional regulator [Microbacterium resistens]|uniref:AcrR family transcriptional regulator n=1 Tax=Microbacterium resistens TaxID=156977 RepID=A0ABU1SBJ6_9MICO|nr:TetR/AcrR family transcriptional regulator [Microbacterium resistens]MDR6866994.1 AcrR family transcriptional regulator [Microbacterium resistens]
MQSNQIGRPYVPGITEALLHAAERIMVSEGFSALTVDRLVTEIGSTRPTFYRRFPNIAHLALEVVRKRFGTGTPVDTGSLAEDLLILQREEIAMFASPLLRNNLPGLLDAARTDASVRTLYETEFIGPRRANVARVIAAGVERGEVPEVDDIDYVCDLLFGPVIVRALLPVGAALDDRLARETRDSAMERLRRS